MFWLCWRVSFIAFQPILQYTHRSIVLHCHFSLLCGDQWFWINVKSQWTCMRVCLWYCWGLSSWLCSWKFLYAAWANWAPFIFNGPSKRFARIQTPHSRDFCPVQDAYKKYKIWTPGTPNFGAFDGKVDTSAGNSSAAAHFLDLSSHFVRGTEGPYLSSKCRHSADSTLTPRNQSRPTYTAATLFLRRTGQIGLALMAFGLQRDPPVNGGSTAAQIGVKFQKT